MLNTAYDRNMRPAAPDKIRMAAHNNTTLYFGCPDVDQTYTYLLHKGLSLKEPRITEYGWKPLSVTDPDGFQVCFHWPLQNHSKIDTIQTV